jgi:hypothetical protein
MAEVWTAVIPFIASSAMALFGESLGREAYRRFEKSLEAQAAHSAEYIRTDLTCELANRGQDPSTWHDMIESIVTAAERTTLSDSATREAKDTAAVAALPARLILSGFGYAILVDSWLAAVVLLVFVIVAIATPTRVHPVDRMGPDWFRVTYADLFLHTLNLIGICVALINRL